MSSLKSLGGVPRVWMLVENYFIEGGGSGISGAVRNSMARAGTGGRYVWTMERILCQSGQTANGQMGGAKWGSGKVG
jgi:hypothetical protein